MRGLEHLGLNVAATGMRAAGVVAASSAVASASTTFASCSANDDPAICVAWGTATSPVT